MSLPLYAQGRNPSYTRVNKRKHTPPSSRRFWQGNWREMQKSRDSAVFQGYPLSGSLFRKNKKLVFPYVLDDYLSRISSHYWSSFGQGITDRPTNKQQTKRHSDLQENKRKPSSPASHGFWKMKIRTLHLYRCREVSVWQVFEQIP